MTNDKEIAMIPDKFGTLPIDMAVLLGHKDMVNYLYEETRNFFTDDDHIALQLLIEFEDLATAHAENDGTALHVLARKGPTYSDFTNQNQRGIFNRWFKLIGKSFDL
ncbi:Ankyrin repeat family protein [Melia azedarach]|uniref:Ankyrin repeat family protein n=1 Tax=Melia azedarach TaxID=155640 RepID=A0ACC1WTX8_MELAZ|nr:Ankyrin repeat family protein [Melia azedarach]